MYLSNKEKSAIELSVKLRAEGKIKDRQPPFVNSTKKEINALIEKNVMRLIRNPRNPTITTFPACIVNEINFDNNGPYEKSRMVVHKCFLSPQCLSFSREKLDKTRSEKFLKRPATSEPPTCPEGWFPRNVTRAIDCLPFSYRDIQQVDIALARVTVPVKYGIDLSRKFGIGSTCRCSRYLPRSIASCRA
jgi:hypothetical protein